MAMKRIEWGQTEVAEIKGRAAEASNKAGARTEMETVEPMELMEREAFAGDGGEGTRRVPAQQTVNRRDVKVVDRYYVSLLTLATKL